MPFDMIKTNMQKEKPFATIREALKSYANRGNARSLFTGWRIRLCQYFIHGVFTMNILEKMEIMDRKLKQQAHNVSH